MLQDLHLGFWSQVCSDDWSFLCCSRELSNNSFYFQDMTDFQVEPFPMNKEGLGIGLGFFEIQF